MGEPHIRLAELPRADQAILRGYTNPIDAAAIATLPPDTAQVPASLFRRGRPSCLSIHSTMLGRIGLIALPFTAEQLVHRSRTLEAIEHARDLAQTLGARTVSLTGLIPSATRLGLALTDRSPRVTTGHATTVCAVALAMHRGLTQTRLDITQETLAVVGLGSIGSSSLELLQRTLPAPSRLLLCDLYANKARLVAIRDRIAWDCEVEVCLSTDPNAVPDTVYEARVVLGATNIANVIDVARLRVGTLIIDDSAPHCFDVERALARHRDRGDLLVHEGGLLRLPQPMSHEVFATDLSWLTPSLRHMAFGVDQAMGCVLSGALSERMGLPITLGEVAPEEAHAHYRCLSELGVDGARLQCEHHEWSEAAMQRFAACVAAG